MKTKFQWNNQILLNKDTFKSIILVIRWCFFSADDEVVGCDTSEIPNWV